MAAFAAALLACCWPAFASLRRAASASFSAAAASAALVFSASAAASAVPYAPSCRGLQGYVAKSSTQWTENPCTPRVLGQHLFVAALRRVRRLRALGAAREQQCRAVVATTRAGRVLHTEGLHHGQLPRNRRRRRLADCARGRAALGRAVQLARLIDDRCATTEPALSPRALQACLIQPLAKPRGFCTELFLG